MGDMEERRHTFGLALVFVIGSLSATSLFAGMWLLVFPGHATWGTVALIATSALGLLFSGAALAGRKDG